MTPHFQKFPPPRKWIWGSTLPQQRCANAKKFPQGGTPRPLRKFLIRLCGISAAIFQAVTFSVVEVNFVSFCFERCILCFLISHLMVSSCECSMSEQLCPDQSAKIHMGFTWLIERCILRWMLPLGKLQQKSRRGGSGIYEGGGEFHPVEISLRWHSVAEGECCLISICEGGGEFLKVGCHLGTPQSLFSLFRDFLN